MYKDYFGLNENPFNVTADPAYFYSSRHHMEAFSHLQYGIQHRKGILVVTGEVGTGKTMLCRALLNRLDRKTRTAFILYPNFSEIQLLHLIINDLGIPIRQKNKAALIASLNEFLLEESAQGCNVVLIVDEAQNLKESQLEQIRLLSNLETEKEKLLQIILCGQPELGEKLKLSSLRQLNQRIAIRYHIQPLEKEELLQYINHRLKIAGANGRLKFTPAASDLIFQYSQGTPRLVNILCDRALLAAFVGETYKIDADIVQNTIEEIGKNQ